MSRLVLCPNMMAYSEGLQGQSKACHDLFRNFDRMTIRRIKVITPVLVLGQFREGRDPARRWKAVEWRWI